MTEHRENCVGVSRLRALAEFHERRANSKLKLAEDLDDPISRATVLGNADTHDVAAACARRVLEGKAIG